ncbi:MAG: Na+/H+ antiporter NhaA [Thermoanaerobaculia bacterium]
MFGLFRRKGVLTPVQQFFHTESASGVILMAATLLALVCANSPLRAAYEHLLHIPVRIGVGAIQVDQSLLHFVNDGLMAVFFLLVGLEIKREIRYGELSDVRSALFPIAAAVGGATLPAIIYFALNRSGEAAAGWAIPMATDIAFALGVLALLGDRIPSWLKVFLMTLAIVDDLIAVLVIAVFYTESLSLAALGWALLFTGALILVNAAGVYHLGVYLLFGVALWFAVLQSGVHATIAGVVLGLTIPARRSERAEEEARIADESVDLFQRSISGIARRPERESYEAALSQLGSMIARTESPLHRLERKLHSPVAFGIVPIFALANAGVVLSADAVAGAAASPVSAGIVLGLVFGKQIGIFLAAFLLIRLGWSRLEADRPTLRALYGTALLGGIGFTMSLFVASLGFGEGVIMEQSKMAILSASLISGLAGYFVLRTLPPATDASPFEDG